MDFVAGPRIFCTLRRLASTLDGNCMTFKSPVLPIPRLVALVLLTISGSRALAQGAPPVSNDRSVDVQLFQPAIGPRNFLTVDSAELPGHKQPSFGLVLQYQDRPYVIYTKGAQPTNTAVVKSQMGADLGVAVGLYDRVQVGLSLPFTPSIKGDVVDQFGTPTGEKLDTYGLGDLRLEVKSLLATLGADDQLAFAGLAGITLPTGKDSAYLGDKTVTGRLKAIGTYQVGHARAAVNLGVILRQTSHSFETVVGNTLVYGGAFAYQFPHALEAMVEIAGRSGLADFFQFYTDVNPIEIDAAARLAVSGMWSLMAGGGAGVGKGIGTPRFRGFLGAQFTPDFHDRDHDGVPDVNDKCPDDPEDKDGFQDSDGCPDPDNDNDGIPDAGDKCPNDPEDIDQFQDQDGCPEADNDGDGIPDINDACPNAPEDGKGARPHDGCPSTAEDADGDGIPDGVDKCPNEPEDKDGFQDDDGCPDPDNDKDGFPDAQDKCPNEPETLNGIKDDDGCPDPGAEIVHFSAQRIDLDEKLAFQIHAGKATSLKERSVAAVGTVALVMRAHPEVKKLRIQLQAAGVTAEESQRRADIVRDTLVSRGVELERLEAAGLGQGSPRVDFIVETITVPAAAPPKPPRPAAEKPAGGGQ